jgi:hypothetical protein
MLAEEESVRGLVDAALGREPAGGAPRADFHAAQQHQQRQHQQQQQEEGCALQESAVAKLQQLHEMLDPMELLGLGGGSGASLAGMHVLESFIDNTMDEGDGACGCLVDAAELDTAAAVAAQGVEMPGQDGGGMVGGPAHHVVGLAVVGDGSPKAGEGGAGEFSGGRPAA